MPFFSVVIPTYNRAAFLGKTLDSVLRQSFRDFEIIVVDDGSTDSTKELLVSFGNIISSFRQQNLGPGAARNLGVSQSTGQYVVFLDSDDLWFPWTLATYARIIQENGKPSIVCGALKYFTDESELTNVAQQPTVTAVFSDFFAAGRDGLYCGSGQMAVLRDAFLDVGGFKEGHFNAEDHDLMMRLGTAPGFINLSAPDMIAYRQHAAATTRDLTKTVVGALNLVTMEKAGNYPGGADRRRDRRRILSQHIRPLTLTLLRQKDYATAWGLYRETFAWNLLLGRFLYLLGFCLKYVLRSWGLKV